MHPDFKSHCWGCEDEVQLTHSAVNRETVEENNTPLKRIMQSTRKLELHWKLPFFKDISVYSWDFMLPRNEMILSPSLFLFSISHRINHRMLLYDVHALFYFWWATKCKPCRSCVYCCGATHETIETHQWERPLKSNNSLFPQKPQTANSSSLRGSAWGAPPLFTLELWQVSSWTGLMKATFRSCEFMSTRHSMFKW